MPKQKAGLEREAYFFAPLHDIKFVQQSFREAQTENKINNSKKYVESNFCCSRKTKKNISISKNFILKSASTSSIQLEETRKKKIWKIFKKNYFYMKTFIASRLHNMKFIAFAERLF